MNSLQHGKVRAKRRDGLLGRWTDADPCEWDDVTLEELPDQVGLFLHRGTMPMLRCHVRISRDDLMKLWPSPGEAGRNVHGDLVSVATIAPAGGAEDAGAERAEAEANTGTPGNLKAGVGRPNGVRGR